MKFQLNKEYTDEREEEIKELAPSFFHLILHNDDFTPREFVIGLLEKFLFMDRSKATNVTMQAHMNGMAICGTFAKDFAESKAAQLVDYARENEFPLMCTAEVAV